MSIELSISINASQTLAKLDQTLQNIQEGITIVEFDMDEAIHHIVGLAKAICPKGATGNLAESIRAEGSFPAYILLADAEDKYGIQYGKFIEYGTSKMEARPFMWPSIEAIMFDYIPKIRRDYASAIRGE